MHQLNAISATREIKERILDFNRSEHFLKDEQLDGICQAVWGGAPQNGGLGGELYVEAALPPRDSNLTLGSAVEAGLIEPKLAKLLDSNEAFGLDWSLRQIQHESLKIAKRWDNEEKKPCMVVSAGTGAGKTESFLMPMLNHLMKHPREENEGCSAIILYPMNALVEDQVSRLREWLKNQTDLSFFHFTGDSPENYKTAGQRGGKLPDEPEFVSRQHARGIQSRESNGKLSNRGPQPDIIITNYSMLEYMLCRPQDGVFFGKNLRHVVLDEAHLYSGNLAAEITMLLRRLAARCEQTPSDIFHYATSATLTEGSADEQATALTDFASKLFSKEREAIEVVIGDKVDPEATAPAGQAALPQCLEDWPDHQAISIRWNKKDAKEKEYLVESSDEEWDDWTVGLQSLFPNLDVSWDGPKEIAPFLHERLPGQTAFRAAYAHLYKNKIVSLTELSERVWGSSDENAQEATRRILQAAAIARQSTNKSPLLPNRIHWSSKAPDGLFFSFHHEHSPTPAQIYRHEGKPLGYVFAPGYGSRPDDDDSVALAIVRHSRLGNWYLAGFDRHESVVEPSEASPQNYDQWKSQIGVGPGKLASPLQIFSLSKTGSLGEMRVDFDPSIGALGSGGVQLWAQEMDEDERDELSPLGAFSRLQMTILAEAALQQQPVYADGSRKYKPNQGRRLLIFSDSRAAAAKLGPRLTDNHETQLFRAAVVEALEKGALTGGDKQALDEELRSALELQAQAPVQMQQLMQAGIDQLREKIASSREGMSPTEFAVQLGNTERIGEFFCRSSGERTRADNWDQDKFDLNKDEMKTAISESLGRELARRAVWPTTDLQTTGLVELSYPGLEKIGIPKAWEGVLVDPGVADKLRLVFSDYLALLCDELRLQGAVTLNDPEKDREYGGGKVRLGRWVSKEHTYLRGLFAFVPGDRGNRLFRFTQRMLTDCGACIKESKNLSRRLMADVFDRLIDEKDSLPWMEVEPRQSDVGATTDAFRIKFLATGIRRPGSLYSCSRTEEVWGRSAAGHYPKSSGASLAKASLEEIDALPRSGRARREWKDSKIFRYGLWAEEHSAQLSPAENRRLQDLFKLGIRNILSSTTTLELGIDIGGLNGVLMGNIPPGKANYLQRAGRAGRRADGSSLVLSYAGSSPFERKIHEDFGAFFAMPLRKPTIFLERADILKRHLTAFLLGRFFREIHTAEDHVGAMRAFGNVGSFVNARQPQYWKDGVKPSIVTPGNVVNITVGGKESTTFNSLAKAFCAYLEAIPTNGLVLGELAILAKGTVLGEVVQSGIKGFTHAVLDQVKGAIERWEEIYNNLVDTWDSLPPHHEPANARQANAMRHQTNQLFNITVIEFFSDALIVPKYGFPTGLAELKVQEDPDRKDEEDPSSDPSYRLSRSAVQAIQEYAPGSKILAGAKVIESAGILKSWTGDDLPDDGMGLRAYYRKEKVSGQFSYQYSPYTPHDIAFDYGQMLFVKHGFTTAASNPPHYGRETERVGECDASCQDDNAVEVLKFDRFTNQKTVAAKLVVGGQMLARNTGRYGRGFAVCTKCGCAESEFVENGNGAIDLPGTMDHHAPLDWRKKKASDKRLWCWKPETAAVLRNLELSAQQIADYAEFSLPRFLGPSRTLGRTLAQAMRLAGSELLMLDPREITVVGVQTGSKFGFCLADSLAGGAGHLRDLCASQQETWWQKTCELIQTGSPKEALLRLITSDVPRRAGRADFSIDEARLYLQNFGVAQGNLFDDDFNEIDPLSEMSSKSPT